MRSWKEIQQRLIDLGYDLGPSGADGDPGRYTKAAVSKFQADKRVPVQWPGTVGPKTLAALFPEDVTTVPPGGTATPAEVPPLPLVRAPWVQIGLRKQGLMETGSTKAELVKFLKSDGKTLGDPAKLPWCGDFVQTCIALAVPEEPVPTNPYWARNWMNFGHAIDPTFGAVIVFARGTAGHVAFVLGETADKKNFVILGGNQSNRISVTTKSKKDWIGCTWPSRVDTPTAPLPVMKGTGRLSINEV